MRKKEGKDDNILVWVKDGDQRILQKYDTKDYLYFYVEDDEGEHTSIYGKKLKRLEFSNIFEFYKVKEEIKKHGYALYESDIPPELKLLADKFYDIPAPNLNISFYDIEVDYNKDIGFASPTNPYAPINAVSIFHKFSNRLVAIVVPPKDQLQWFDKELLIGEINKTIQIPTEYKFDLYICENEMELLVAFLEEIKNSDGLSGWNCIPEEQSVWLHNHITSIKKIKENDILMNSTVIKKSPVSIKEKYDITLKNGMKISASGDHKFPVLFVENERYTNFGPQNIFLNKDDSMRVSSMYEDINNSFFVEIPIHTNTNIPLPDITNEQLYLAGFIYTDGTLKDKHSKKSNYVISQSDLSFISKIPLVTLSIIGPYTRCYRRNINGSVFSKFIHNLIYDENNEKRLNLEDLSRLSYEQFMYFLSGFLDGDGFVGNGQVALCNYNKNDIDIMQELLLWNGIFSLKNGNTIRLIDVKLDDLHLLKEKRWNGLENKLCSKLNRDNKQKAKYIKFKKINNSYFVRIKKIEKTSEEVSMYDIETDTNFFITNGVKTHNCEFFDTPYICKRLEHVLGNAFLKKMSFEGGDIPTYKEVERFGIMHLVAELSGRLDIDYLALVKKYDPTERASFKLESLAEEFLTDEATNESKLPKLEYDGSLHDLYRNNFPFFVRYNIRDAEILNAFEDKLGYVKLANEMYHISTGLFKHVTGTLKLSDLATINYCHHKFNYIVPDFVEKPARKIKGAYVLYPQTGLHNWVGSIDINSLYPSAIRSINISPETLRGQFHEEVLAAEEIAKNSDVKLTFEYEINHETETLMASEWREKFITNKWAVSGFGTVFEQTTKGIVPSLLEEWFEKRKEYKKKSKEAFKAGDKEKGEYFDRLQYVIKIKLNSFYGAISNQFFRFFDLRMGESTTGTGRMILKHQCRKVSEFLEGDYNVEFPLYLNKEDAIEMGESPNTALNGELFDGKFQANNIISGDTDSTYFTIPATNKDEATLLADEITKGVNKSFPQFMRDTFLCTDGFDDKIASAREMVASSGLFIEKKRYILNVVDVEGKATKKLKMMGVELKKTTIPKPIRKKLTEFIKRLLDGDSWSSISRDVVEYKKELMRPKNILTLGLPKGVKRVEHYTSEYKTIGDKARLPGHIAAAIFWNECLIKYNDKQSPKIMSGMKLKVFYLTKSFGKFKSIAVPVDIEVMPQWFLDDFVSIIDCDMQIERLIDNPLENMISVLGKIAPSEQTIFEDSIFEF